MGFVFGIIFLFLAKPMSSTFFTIGIFLACVGEFIRLIASGFIIKTDELAMSGPYAFVRHPLYLGSFVMGLGLCVSIISSEYLLISLIVLCLYLLFFFGVYITVLKKEELVMIEKYGDKYLEYKKHVPMLLPRPLPYASNQSSKFSKDTFMRNREYRALIGLIFIMIFLMFRFA